MQEKEGERGGEGRGGQDRRGWDRTGQENKKIL